MMGTYARATTDETGRQLGAGFDFGVKMVRLDEAPQNPFEVPMGRFIPRRLGDLLSNNSHFHLLGSYLTNELNIPASTKCEVQKRGIIRAVRINGKEYRSDSVNIYRRRDYRDVP